jgi:hypothetical protein
MMPAVLGYPPEIRLRAKPDEKMIRRYPNESPSHRLECHDRARQARCRMKQEVVRKLIESTLVSLDGVTGDPPTNVPCHSSALRVRRPEEFSREGVG